jgi:hypothetical protein
MFFDGLYSRVGKSLRVEAYVIYLAAKIGSRRPSIPTSINIQTYIIIARTTYDALGPRKHTVSVDLEYPMMRIES